MSPELERLLKPCYENPWFEDGEYPFLNGPAVQVRHRTVDTATRNRILDRDGRRCQACWSTDRPLEVDHKVPVCRGGTHDDSNLWTLCKPCNHVKATFTVREFQFFILRVTGKYVEFGQCA